MSQISVGGGLGSGFRQFRAFKVPGVLVQAF